MVAAVMEPSNSLANVGLALSGGGSRAAAFHLGTVRALLDLGLLPTIDVISTVSGGSIFGAAWVVSIANGDSTMDFLARMKEELQHGFIRRSLSWRLLLLMLPGYTRSDLLAHTFDRIFFKGRTLSYLPQRPRLCINTTVLNHGHVGKFAADGFSTPDLGPPRGASGSNVPFSMPDFPIARAATASAAFPIGLPPILLSAADFSGAVREGMLAGTAPLALTDGGVLENLGVQTLLKSRRFGAQDIIISDAGLKDRPWRPRSFGRWLTALLIALFSASVLRRVLELMNDKQNRSMRALAFAELERSRMQEQFPKPRAADPSPSRTRRKMMFIRVNQTLDSLLMNLPHWRLRELAQDPSAAMADLHSVHDIGRYLEERTGVILTQVREAYAAMGGDERVAELNRIGTGFTALSSRDVEGLAQHAAWQVRATHALYW
jgi:predicted acylesterase/phospholipase RssA